jgi:predicted nucleotidyltransferase component of viral defense system
MEDNRKYQEKRSLGGVMINPNVISKISREDDIGWGIVEKDYFITLLLDGIAQEKELFNNLVFKGGTALRKVYFSNYRYSEDLDFTLIKEVSENEIKDSISRVFGFLSKEYGGNFRIKGFYNRKWFTDVKVQFRGLKGGKNTITIDLATDETIVNKVKKEKVFNPYYEKQFDILVYSLEEILAEKLRSFIQRTRVRDYYDVWYLLHNSKKDIDLKLAKKIFLEKIKFKKLDIPTKEELLVNDKIEQAKAYYKSKIGDQIKELPDFDGMIDKLRKEINSFY